MSRRKSGGKNRAPAPIGLKKEQGQIKAANFSADSFQHKCISEYQS